MRETLQSYFNRRTTYNRRTNALSNVYGDDTYRKFSERSKQSPQESIFSYAREENDLSNDVELAFYEFEADEADQVCQILHEVFNRKK